ncbi:hypothetical protein TRFO_17367 [Tritrichomonas foetus]|uniref:Uncharacterized protein n=1 Tax=Tritrichomonas foetus TaxID=1144522 RepID=A0A1J4KP90_9EUKA|nr:hypothetical protein TRFO_17367 [Tritrichomonas foetus]|eukprot:OHT12736.1 hypothetical protein TRFO_17367 [Tritrichomonas foetus]
MAALVDQSNPLAALLAQTPIKPTPLDDRLRQFSSTAPVNKQARKDDRIIVLDKDPESDLTNISLGYRQPSFNSLSSDVVVTKAGNVIETDLPQLPEEVDPVIVFDQHSSDNEGAIGLTVRQPSFVSLHGQLIPKGSDSLADFQPIIEEVTPLPAEKIDEIEEGEDNPQVLFIHELKAKNTARWREMGYEPPEDLIPLARAASHAMIMNNQTKTNPITHSQNFFAHQNELTPKSATLNSPLSSPSISPLSPQASHNVDKFNENDANLNSPFTHANSSSKSPVHRRGSSFGMDLGDAANRETEMMNEILGSSDRIVPRSDLRDSQQDDQQYKFQLESIPQTGQSQAEQVYSQNSSNINSVNGNDEEDGNCEILYGRLADLDDDFIQGPAYSTILTGEVNFDSNFELVRKHLRAVADVCADNLWVEETAYLNQLLEIAYQTPGPTRKLGFRRNEPEEDIESIRAAKHEEASKFDEIIEEIRDKLKDGLADIDNEYQQRAAELDKKYQDPKLLRKYSKPSKELLNLRYSAKKLLRANRISEATTLTAQIRQLEADEEYKINSTIRAKYHQEDRKLKEEFAAKRKSLVERFQAEEERIISEKKKSLRVYNRMIAKIRNQISNDVPIRPGSSTTNQKNNETDTNDTSSFADIGRLALKAPKPLQRQNDIDILNGMTEELLRNKNATPQEVDINKIFRKTLKQ